jgi:hypothetical protein
MNRRLGRSGDERERVAYQIDGVNRKMNSGESREEDAVISVLSFQSDRFSKSRIQRIDFTAMPAPGILSLLIPWHIAIHAECCQVSKSASSIGSAVIFPNSA